MTACCLVDGLLLEGRCCPSSHRALEVQVAVPSKMMVTLFQTVMSHPIRLQSFYSLP